MKNTDLEAQLIFPTLTYNGNWPDFIEVAKEVAAESIERVTKDQNLNDLFPVNMSEHIGNDPRLAELVQAISQHGWNILESQGYQMQDKRTITHDFWLQEHYKHSLMEQHVHGYGAQLIGFYFLETPENCSPVIFHDPRPGKFLVNIPEEDRTKITNASEIASFMPKPGDIIFASSWLPHSFGRHGSNEPLRFIHFNIYIEMAPREKTCCAPAEVV